MSRSKEWLYKPAGWSNANTIAYLKRARAMVESLTPGEIAERLRSLSNEQEVWRERLCLNLIAGENITTPVATQLLAQWTQGRGPEGLLGAKHLPGTKYLDEIEAMVCELAKKLFRAKYAEYRPPSGSIANAAVFYALTKPDDTIITPSHYGGAHVSCRPEGVPGFRGLNVVSLPFTEDYNVDTGELKKIAKEAKPKLILVGAMVILFPYPLNDIREIADGFGARVIYDGAHVGSLIAAGMFQDPLREGADVLIVNSHKIMAGPLGGIILCNDGELADRISSSLTPGIVSALQQNRFGGIGITLAEHLAYGKAYAKQIVRNAKALAKTLDENKFVVVGKDKGYTETHQVILDVTELGGGGHVTDMLAKANITCNGTFMPKDYGSERRSGLRIGVQEVTKFGMKEKEMELIADLMKRTVINKEEPTGIANEVAELKQNFANVCYCF